MCGDHGFGIFISDDKEIIKRLDNIKSLHNQISIYAAENPINNTPDVLSYIPTVGKLFSEFPPFLDLIFGKMDANTRYFINSLKDFFQTASNELNDLTISSDNYYDCVSNIYQTLKQKITEFSKKESLLNAPIIVALSRAVAAFEPIAENLMPSETAENLLPCQAYDILIDYRLATVSRRIDALTLEPEYKFKAKTALYNPNGYAEYDSDKIAKCLHDSQSQRCSYDDFGYKYCNSEPDCHVLCAQHIRHKVEEVFPEKKIKQECHKYCPKRNKDGKHLFDFDCTFK